MPLKKGCIENCPGCSHRKLTMEQSLEQKEQWLQTKLAPWKDKFSPIRSLKEEERWNYRGKVCLNTRYHNHSWEFGMLKRDEFIDIPGCPVHTIPVLQTIALLKQVLPSGDHFPMAFYHHTHSLVTLVLKTKSMPDTDWLTPEIKQKLHEIGINGVAIHLHPSAGRRLFAKWGWHQVYGENYAYDHQGLLYGNTSFHQLIDDLYLQSLNIAEEFFRPSMPQPVADLYCGRGVSLCRWRKYEVPVIGIETGGEAVACARINAPGADILQGTCERRIPQLEAWRQEQQRDGYSSFALYTNPPRTGMEPSVTEWIIHQLKPSKIAYLSCSAGTLKRDLDQFTSANYEVNSVIPFDFFPQTYHVECLVLMEK